MVWSVDPRGLSGPIPIEYARMFPLEWLARFSPQSLWIEAHRIPHLPGADTPHLPRSADLGDVCAAFIRSVLGYQTMRPPSVDIATRKTWSEVMTHPPQMQIPLLMEGWIPETSATPAPDAVDEQFGDLPDEAGVLIIHNLQVVNHRTNLGTFVILATPHRRSGEEAIEEQSKERLRSAAGLLGAVMGRNAVYERLFSFEVDLGGAPVSPSGVVFENPGVFKAPDLSVAGLGLLELCASRISSLETHHRDRLNLSLRWFYEAMDEFDGVFSFLKFWIALETLAMPDSTNIKPITQALAGAYNISEEDARTRFSVGRLFDLRGRIVHNGATPIIGQDLLAYIEGVYVDTLANQLGTRTTGIAQAALERSGQNVAQLADAATPIARRRLRAELRRESGITPIAEPGSE